MEININTKISKIIKAHPDALNAIISINKKFDKLKNPILRRVMAPRTSIAMAARIGECKPVDFFKALTPLGFTIGDEEEKKENYDNGFAFPIHQEDVTIFDARPILEKGDDPLKEIVHIAQQILPGKFLKIINTFEPLPLVSLLEKKCFKAKTVSKNHGYYETFFLKNSNRKLIVEPSTENDWDKIYSDFKENFVEIDVSELEMPLPMTTILENLDVLPQGKALYVNHKKIPVFLLSELKERNFNYTIKEIKEGEVKLIIFRK